MSETVRAGERHPEHTPFYLLLLLSYLTLGAMVLTVNTAMPAVAGEYGWTDAQGALLITCLSAGNVIASFVTGVITARLGIRRIMCLYALLIALSCALFALLPVPALFYPLMLCAGLSWGGFNTLVNTGVSLMYPGSTSRLNIGHACYGVTAVIFPLLVGFVLLHGGSWRIPVGGGGHRAAPGRVDALHTHPRRVPEAGTAGRRARLPAGGRVLPGRGAALPLRGRGDGGLRVALGMDGPAEQLLRPRPQ